MNHNSYRLSLSSQDKGFDCFDHHPVETEPEHQSMDPAWGPSRQRQENTKLPCQQARTAGLSLWKTKQRRNRIPRGIAEKKHCPLVRETCCHERMNESMTH